MATDRQYQANRLNALRSTGPRTSEGRAISSRNAITHGLTAGAIIIKGEDADLFEEMRQGLWDELAPKGEIESMLVERLAGLLWRLRRVPALEAALFVWMERSLAAQDEQDNPMYQLGFEPSNASPPARGDDQRQDLGRVLEAMLSNQDLLGKLNRYEAQLMNQFERTMAEIERCKANRRPAIDALAKNSD